MFKEFHLKKMVIIVVVLKFTNLKVSVNILRNNVLRFGFILTVNHIHVQTPFLEMQKHYQRQKTHVTVSIKNLEQNLNF